jgi:predicted RecB family nuclease
MRNLITAAMLYDLVHCPHRVTMDLFADPKDRDENNAFVELLWARGTLYEKEVINALKPGYLDLTSYSANEKLRLTSEAMARGESLICGGRIQSDDLLGEPDLLRREEIGYIPGDIKSGAGEEGPDDDKKPKKHYAVQLALYVDILERLARSGGRRAFVWDIHGDEIPYNLATPKGAKTEQSLWDDYQEALTAAREIMARSRDTLPAYGAVCKLCHWYTTCLATMQKTGDLTLIPELGRVLRDNMRSRVASIQAFAAADPNDFIAGKKTVFPGLGPDRLRKFHARARLLSENGTPYCREPVRFPQSQVELFFDIEHDPLRDVCYLHGFIERTNRDDHTERFVSFFADDPTVDQEERAFAGAIRYIQGLQPCAIYYYSKYERTVYRTLRDKYPHVITEEALEGLFDPTWAVDLYYDVVFRATEWPTPDFSIKTLAKYLNFAWRDAHPSGAASIEWFHRWIETRDPAIKARILEYNEDDCRAMRILRDAVEKFQLVTT